MRTASGIRIYKLNAYAKLNLYLDITGRRDDGYHLLETVWAAAAQTLRQS